MIHSLLDAAVAEQCVAAWGDRLRTPWDVVAMVREHPAVFLDPVGITSMAGLLQGFGLATPWKADERPPWPRFVEWLAVRSGHRGEVPGLARMLLQEAGGDDEGALARLWEHVDAWASDPPRRVASATPTAWRAPRGAPPERVSLWSTADGASWLSAEPGGELGPLRPSADIVRRYAEMALGLPEASWITL